MSLASQFYLAVSVMGINKSLNYYGKNSYISSGIQIDTKTYIVFFTDDSLYVKSEKKEEACTKKRDPLFYNSVLRQLELAKTDCLMEEITAMGDYTLAYIFEKFLKQHTFVGGPEIHIAINQFEELSLIDKKVIHKSISFIGFIDHSFYAYAEGKEGAIFKASELPRLLTVIAPLDKVNWLESFALIKAIESNNVRPQQKDTS